MDAHLPVCVVGYALNPKKLRKSSKGDHSQKIFSNDSSARKKDDTSCESMTWRGGGLADILDAVVDDGTHPVRFVQWDHERPLTDQPKFHVLIHKLTEDIDRPESLPKMTALDQYLRRYPDTVIVDPVSAVRKVISRQCTCNCLDSVQRRLRGSCPFRLPNFVVIEDDDTVTDAEVLERIYSNKINFPIICKPVEACGTPLSHTMAVIVSEEDIGLMQRPCVVQQYYNHNESFYKIYVIGDDVMVFKRASLPNLDVLPSLLMDSQEPVISFPAPHVAHTDHTEDNYDGHHGICNGKLSNMRGRYAVGESKQQQQYLPIGSYTARVGNTANNAGNKRGYVDAPRTTSSTSSTAFGSTTTGSSSSSCTSSTSTSNSLHNDDNGIECLSSQNQQDRKRVKLRSVVFDSRKNYPTIADFLPKRKDSTAAPIDQSYSSAVPHNGISAVPLTEATASAVRCRNPSFTFKLQDNPRTVINHEGGDGSFFSDGVTLDLFRETARLIREELGLTLFGFDAIVPVSLLSHQSTAGQTRTPPTPPDAAAADAAAADVPPAAAAAAADVPPAAAAAMTTAVTANNFSLINLTFASASASEAMQRSQFRPISEWKGGAGDEDVVDPTSHPQQRKDDQMHNHQQHQQQQQQHQMLGEQEAPCSAVEGCNGNSPNSTATYLANNCELQPQTTTETATDITTAAATANAAKIVVIDVNYFPSYKEVPDFPYRFRKLCYTRMLEAAAGLKQHQHQQHQHQQQQHQQQQHQQHPQQS